MDILPQGASFEGLGCADKDCETRLKMFRRGDIVWAKLKNYSYWPAMIINPQDCGRDSVGKNRCWVFWFGDHQIAQVEYSQVLDFKQYFCEKAPVGSGQKFRCSMHEGLIILATRYNIAYSDPSSLIDWGNEGFKTKLRCRSNEPNTLELPDIVMKALKNCRQPNHASNSEEGSENEIDKVFGDVLRGRKALEDICIVCCKTENSVIMQHPLFIGGSCQICKKSIIKILKCPKGQMNIICVVCGEGGKLVYCCNSECKSSYCETCIDYMTPKRTFSKILKDSNWNCYLCEQSSGVNCLIKRREAGFSMKIKFPMAANKLPIRVIGFTDAALPVLKKKKIAVALYHTESTKCPSTSKQDYYKDFTREEILEICPDLIYGAFFVPPTAVADKKKNIELFLESFYKFLFRLNNAKEAKATVFFLFISDSSDILDAEMKSRVRRFIQLEPVIIELPKQQIAVWSNIPAVDGIEDNKITLKSRTLVEEGVLKKFLDPLKDFFKQEF